MPALNIERLLELDDRELGLATCNLTPVNKSVRGPRGTRARWTLAGATLSGLPLETTLFVGQGRVRRIEQYWASTDRDCASIPGLNLVTIALNAKFGTPAASNLCTRPATSEESHAWVSNDTAIAAYIERSPAACLVRLVLQRQQIKDASEL